MSKDSSVKDYHKNKERLQKKLVRGIKIFLKKRKMKNHNMVANNIKTFLKMNVKYGSAFQIQVLHVSAIKCRGNFRIFQFASGIAKATAKDSADTFVNYTGYGFSMPRAICQGL